MPVKVRPPTVFIFLPFLCFNLCSHFPPPDAAISIPCITKRHNCAIVTIILHYHSKKVNEFFLHFDDVFRSFSELHMMFFCIPSKKFIYKKI